MQSMLCVDFSSPVIEAGIVSYDDKTSRITLDQVVREDDPKLFAHPSEAKALEAQPADGTTPTETPPVPPTLDERLKKVITSLKELLMSDQNTNQGTLWNSVIAILPSRDTFSVLVTLPIKENRLIQKVLPLEVEDALPLVVEPFHIESTIAAPSGEKGAEVITTLAPKSLLDEHLNPLRGLGLEPDTFTTLEGIISGLGSIIEDPTGNYVLLSQDASDPLHWALAVYVDKMVRHCEHIYGDTTRISQAIKSICLTSEAEYKIPLTTVYALGKLAPLPGVTVTKAPLPSELALFENSPKYLAALSTLISDQKAIEQKLKKLPLAINFRSGDYSYKLQLRELLGSIKKLLPVLGMSLLAVSAALVIWYSMRAYSIAQMESRARDEIATAINDPGLDAGHAHQTLKLRIEEIRARLRDLGSVGKVSPLDALLSITKDFPLQNQVEVRTISIKEKKITIEGSAPEYDSIDKMERALLTKRGTYCRVKSTPTKKGDRGVDFSFEIYLCD